MTSNNVSAAYAYSRLVDIVHQQSIWSQATFGPDEEKGPIGPLKHLEKEAREAYANPNDKTEYADCFLLILDACRRQGISLLDLFNTAYKKLEENRKRKWPEYAKWVYSIDADGDGSYRCEASNGNPLHNMVGYGSTGLEAKTRVQEMIRQQNDNFVEHLS